MADLMVDLGMLEATASSLQHIKDSFSNVGSIVGDADVAVGSPTVQSALGDFANNWKHHRDSLVSSIDAVLQMAQKASQTYRQTDDHLASSLHTKAAS